MAITINGTGTITGISAGGLPDGSVTAADIESSLDLTGKTVTLPSGTGGKILSVNQSTAFDNYTMSWSTNGDSFAMDTDFEVSFTPQDRTNLFLIETCWYVSADRQANVGFVCQENSSGSYVTIKTTDGTTQWKNNAPSNLWPASNDDIQFTFSPGDSTANDEILAPVVCKMLTKLGNTSNTGAVTWKFVGIGGESSPFRINYMQSNSTTATWSMPSTSTTIVTEIAA